MAHGPLNCGGTDEPAGPAHGRPGADRAGLTHYRVSVSVLDRIPWGILIVLCIGLGLAPYFEEPHLVEKTRMLIDGDLTRGIDRFDLVWHLWPFVLVVLKLIRDSGRSTELPDPT